MAQIKLVTISAFRLGRQAQGPAEILFGARAVEWNETSGKWAIQAGDVPIAGRPGVVLPSPGTTLYYGFREVLEQTRQWHQSVAQEEDVYFHMAYVIVEIGTFFKEMVGMADLPHLRFASIRRMKTEVQQEIMARVSELRARAGEPSPQLTNVRELSWYPHLVGEALKTPPFDHLEVFVYPVGARGEKAVQYLGCVRPTAQIVSIEQNANQPWMVVGIG